MSQNKLEAAYETFTKAIELDSNWAEAWNKRATVLYLMGKYEQSQVDIDKLYLRRRVPYWNRSLPLLGIWIQILIQQGD